MPLEKVWQAPVDAPRLDMIRLSAEQQLSAIDNDDDKLQTHQKVWDNLLEQIGTLKAIRRTDQSPDRDMPEDHRCNLRHLHLGPAPWPSTRSVAAIYS